MGTGSKAIKVISCSATKATPEARQEVLAQRENASRAVQREYAVTLLKTWLSNFYVIIICVAFEVFPASGNSGLRGSQVRFSVNAEV